MPGTSVFVTNFNPNFTGVSATAAAVLRIQQKSTAAHLVGQPLPGCAEPIGWRHAIHLTGQGAGKRPFPIWHVRRNGEMMLALWVRDVLKLPIRIVFTSAAQRRHSAWPRLLISRMDAIIATTDAAAEFVGNVWAVVPHGVDTSVFAPSANRTAEWVQAGLPGLRGIACIGRIRPEKGTDRFVDAMINVLPDHPDTTAVVIGQAKAMHRGYLNRLKSNVAAAGLVERIIFPGEISSRELPALLRKMEILVALPRYEGYGMTPLEAMASGVPIVASDVGHFRTFLGADADAFVVPEGNAQRVPKIISGLLTNTEARKNYSNRLRQRAKTEFGVQAEADAIDRIYERLWAGELRRDNV